MVKELVVTFVLTCLASHLSARTFQIKFYSEVISIDYHESILVDHRFKGEGSDQNLREYYDKMKKTNYIILLESLLNYKRSLDLNDWYYFQLIKSVVDKIYIKKTENYKIATYWFFLIESGYQSIVSYSSPYRVYVSSNDEVYNTSRLHLGGVRYYSLQNLKSNHQGNLRSSKKFIPYKDLKPFDFGIRFPKVKNDSVIVVKKELMINGTKESFVYNVDGNYLQFMKGYPSLSVEEYIGVPLSKLSTGSLIPQLRERISTLDKDNAVRFLLSYVRLSFKSQTEINLNGYSHSMIAEEALYNDGGDCEDKAALFYNLCKELLKADMIILKYPKHVNVAIELTRVYGIPVTFGSKNYSVCETNENGDTRDFGSSSFYSEYPKPEVLVPVDSQ